MKRRAKNDYRTSLRIAPEELSSIDALRHQGNGKVSLNAWIGEAIREKLLRDSVRESSPPVYGDEQKTFYEFFAGGGMARLGLGERWCCLFANDFDPSKAKAYKENWHGGSELAIADVNTLSSSDLPGIADLIWASFPCQDLSLAGKNAGIGEERDKKQTRSGTFWPFWRLINALALEGRGPKVIVLENVYGILTSREGKDFGAIGAAFGKSGYRFGALVIDAKMFVPQSRPRVFIVGVRSDLFIPPELMSNGPVSLWHTDALQSAYAQIDPKVGEQWIWWALPEPRGSAITFSDVVDDSPDGVEWHSASETKKLLAMMSPLNLKKIELAKKSRRRQVGGVYRRTRVDACGNKIQRAEVRFDNVAGCLRTPSGGSSRQLVLMVQGHTVRSRLLAPREAARLMGLPDSYRLPRNYNEAYHLCGDGVVVPVVRHLADHLLERLVDSNRPQSLLPLRVS